VRKSGDLLRITVQLVKTSDGYHLWSRQYDRRLEDIFEVQEEIANSIASALSVTLKRNRISARKPVDPRAYDFFFAVKAFSPGRPKKTQCMHGRCSSTHSR
jgi:hypothetical protein